MKHASVSAISAVASGLRRSCTMPRAARGHSKQIYIFFLRPHRYFCFCHCCRCCCWYAQCVCNLMVRIKFTIAKEQFRQREREREKQDLDSLATQFVDRNTHYYYDYNSYHSYSCTFTPWSWLGSSQQDPV